MHTIYKDFPESTRDEENEKVEERERSNMAANKNNLQTVSLKTFKSWDFHQDFTIQDDREKITLLQYNICSHHIAEIRRESKSRGISGPVQII